ncbi:hypothetical protein L6452_35728 [Arctium lappa]|uniref:Uncharacterized protein n=1 Tax=Arctium lappa TaxID=4217 RepID=A0ACB8YBE7_ARCLA|nr:hypothetical protein L6452_35728 [Arctium lappa]
MDAGDMISNQIHFEIIKLGTRPSSRVKLLRSPETVSILSGEDVLLVRVRLTCVEVRSLENDNSIAENEINGVVDVAFLVEFSANMNIEELEQRVKLRRGCRNRDQFDDRRRCFRFTVDRLFSRETKRRILIKKVTSSKEDNREMNEVRMCDLREESREMNIVRM